MAIKHEWKLSQTRTTYDEFGNISYFVVYRVESYDDNHTAHLMTQHHEQALGFNPHNLSEEQLLDTIKQNVNVLEIEKFGADNLSEIIIEVVEVE